MQPQKSGRGFGVNQWLSFKPENAIHVCSSLPLSNLRLNPFSYCPVRLNHLFVAQYFPTSGIVTCRHMNWNNRW